MKKSLFLAALMLISIGCFAQKAVVKKAKNLAGTEVQDLESARKNYREASELIKEALVNDETKDLADTWYVAGEIGFKLFENAKYLSAFGQQIDQQELGAAIAESYKYWVVADSLSQVLVPNKKGVMVAAAPKYRKMINVKMLEYFQNMSLIQYGYKFYEQDANKQAYENFMLHLNMPKLDMMQDAKLQEKMVRDTVFYQYLYYAGRFAYQAEMYPEAIAVFEEMNTPAVEAVAYEKDVLQSYEFIAQIYSDMKDTVAYVEQLKKGMQKFPKEPWFVQNIINHYIYSGNLADALPFLDEAIAQNPNEVQYRVIKGNLHIRLKNFDAAMASFDEALELDPKSATAIVGKGNVYIEQAAKVSDEITYIVDKKEYAKGHAQITELYKKALPFLEQAHELDPENRDYMITLRQIYYRLGMDAKYEAISAEMNK